ncbi:unnamed protein product [Amoebophrya sp. A25]|nr:unnamed protein product [Amoebophrya sp. A25]|eukprot:GSA25T00015879001.1
MRFFCERKPLQYVLIFSKFVPKENSMHSTPPVCYSFIVKGQSLSYDSRGADVYKHGNYTDVYEHGNNYTNVEEHVLYGSHHSFLRLCLTRRFRFQSRWFRFRFFSHHPGAEIGIYTRPKYKGRSGCSDRDSAVDFFQWLQSGFLKNLKSVEYLSTESEAYGIKEERARDRSVSVTRRRERVCTRVEVGKTDEARKIDVLRWK